MHVIRWTDQWTDHGVITAGEERLWEVVTPWETKRNIIDVAEEVGVPRDAWNGSNRGFALLQKSRVADRAHHIVSAPAEWSPVKES